MSTPLVELDHTLAEKGLRRLGGFHLDADEELLEGTGRQGGTVLLIGNDGRSLWHRSGTEIEALRARGTANPLDSWTRATLDPLADGLGVRVVYPFGGPPHAPFTRWALRSTNLHQSPLGLTIHPTFGLWHAFRAAFHFVAKLNLDHVAAESPCSGCLDKPCLSACPVGAFTSAGYDVDSCKAHLGDPAAACWSESCLARVACPVGRNWRYDNRQARFHMVAFRP